MYIYIEIDLISTWNFIEFHHNYVVFLWCKCQKRFSIAVCMNIWRCILSVLTNKKVCVKFFSYLASGGFDVAPNLKLYTWLLSFSVSLIHNSMMEFLYAVANWRSFEGFWAGKSLISCNKMNLKIICFVFVLVAFACLLRGLAVRPAILAQHSLQYFVFFSL